MSGQYAMSTDHRPAEGRHSSASSTLEIVRVTERAAVSAARLRGHGNEKAADQAAVDAMRRELNKLPIDGTVVIGEGERDEAPMLFIGEKVGTKAGPKVDIAVDPLEGTTLCAKDMPGAIAIMAMAEAGTLLHAPDVYMDKIARRSGLSEGRGRTRRARRPTTSALWPRPRASSRTRSPSLVLDRPRHAEMIAGVRKTGAAVRLITDGDVAGVIHTTDARQDRHRHLYRHRRRARGRAGGGGAALHRRPDAGPAHSRHRGASASAPTRWASRIRARTTASRTW